MGIRLRSIRALCAVAALAVAGCAGIRPSQREDIMRWEVEARRMGHPEVKYEKYLDPDTAWRRGFLPGGGFYVKPGLGVSSLVWPVSMLWVPEKARAMAELYNYLEFRQRILTLRQEAQPKIAAPTQLHRIPADPRRATAQLQRLDKLWQAGRLSESEYQQQRQSVLDSMTDEQWEQPVPHPAPYGR